MNLENLKGARQRKNMTLKDVASVLGISYNTYKNYEYGEREPNNDMLLRLATLFNCTTDHLLGHDETSIDPIEQLGLSEDEKIIVSAYINLDAKDRKNFVEIIKKITAGSKPQITITESQEQPKLRAIARSKDHDSLPLPTEEQMAKLIPGTPDMLGD